MSTSNARARWSLRGVADAALWVQPWWLRIPLDHCLATRSFIVTNHHVGPAIGSDHFPLLVTLALPPATR